MNTQQQSKSDQLMQQNNEAQQKKQAEVNREIEKATTPTTVQKAKGFLGKQVENLEKKLQQATHAVQGKYQDLTWHSDDWKKDLSIRMQKWKESVEERINHAGRDSKKKFEEFQQGIDKEFEQLKGKGEHDQNEFTYRKWKTQLKKNYDNMMQDAENELNEWTGEAKKRYSHSRSRVSDKDREEFDNSYKQWRKDMSDFTSAAQKRAHDYYEKCREYIKSKGVEMQNDEEVTKVKKRGEHLLNEQQQKWASAIDEIKEGLKEENDKQQQEQAQSGQQMQQSA
uniref:Uncharacterized protein n=1 Tax=Percolomonas cosmopolitus TaxID=63605 RepID=A0A7S1KQN0_9EUKA|mmetsp:Transcript_5414/g.20208  ORF Transcript_5414/g.20208 Transcript_5414/m.20208 type:complete len:282 (+) Transcript_5414:652-1497(+)|eukprot:CAMPEP_0117447926 /NCGR_PEP_ID=MMETSP0759-20121206/7128_1 /TAXON_ID=63605 /ORGANISM="Percolomonas cosmopolitus, Strain WS" /LENGTH=281 /DNA_ID=CAMNT_0005240279 /DNA_START=542 /DNA_END=1387 /DNA_ORIENTATION=+